MLINLFQLCHYLLVVLVLLPSSNQKSINSDRLRHKNETTEKGGKSLPLLHEVDNFVDGQCPPKPNNVNIQNRDEKCRHECNSDSDCKEDYRCCEHGCSFKCTQPWFPNRVVDWEKSSSLNQTSESLELLGHRNDSWKSRGEPCSTSILDGLQPLRCPTNYVCQVTIDGDVQLNIPNRGECIAINVKKSSSGLTSETYHSQSSIVNTACSHKGETYKHKDKFRKDCNMCVCHSGVIFCDNQPCPVKIGIPAAILSYDELRELPRTVFFDSENRDTRDASGSSGSGGDREDTPEDDSREILDDVVKNTSTKDKVKYKTQNDDNDDDNDELSFTSGDDGETTSDEIHERDNEDDNGGDNNKARQHVVNDHENSDSKVINLEPRGKLDDLEFSGERESVELGTEVPLNPRSSSKIGGPKASYSTLESTETILKISPSTLKTLTSPENFSTLPPKISTVSTELISTLRTEIVMLSSTSENKTTSKAPELLKTKPTKIVIRLEKNNYEPGALSLENYSGDEEDLSGSGDYYGASDGGSASGSGEDTTQQPVYLNDIRLGKYIKGELEGSDIGFQSYKAKIEIVNDSELRRKKVERSGDEEKKDQREYKTESQTVEYLATTDDDN